MNISYQGRCTTDILMPYQFIAPLTTPSRIRDQIEFLRDEEMFFIALQLRQGLLTVAESERLAFDAELRRVLPGLPCMMEVGA